MLASDDVDYIDPGAAYYQFTLMVTLRDPVAPRGLRARRRRGADARLADRGAEVSEDGKTITFTIREGVMFSPPVDREATAADVEYAIERALLPGVANGYVAAYLADVDGFDEALKEAQDNPTGGAPDISGITAPDDTTLEIKLDRHELARRDPGSVAADQRPGAGGVREGVRRREPVDLRGEPVATGPYMVENDSEPASSPATRRARRST